jgi:hypothetical protein
LRLDFVWCAIFACLQRKLYPRNWCVEPGHENSYGRLRVALRKPDGTPVNKEVPTSGWRCN